MEFRAEKGESSEVFCYERVGSCLGHVHGFGFEVLAQFLGAVFAERKYSRVSLA